MIKPIFCPEKRFRIYTSCSFIISLIPVFFYISFLLLKRCVQPAPASASQAKGA